MEEERCAHHEARALVGSLGHRWADFDERAARRQAGDSANASRTFAPAVARYETQYYRRLPEISLPPASAIPAPFAKVIVLKIREQRQAALMDALRRARDSAEAGRRGVASTFYALVSGGETPTLIQVLPVKSWADMDLPDPPFAEFLVPLVGQEAAQSIMTTIIDAVEREERYLLQYRPDLSYRPAAP